MFILNVFSGQIILELGMKMSSDLIKRSQIFGVIKMKIKENKMLGRAHYKCKNLSGEETKLAALEPSDA